MRNSKDEINAILENFIIYACGSNEKERDILEATLNDYQEVMSDEGCGLEDCPFLNEEDEDEEPIDEVSCKVIVGNITFLDPQIDGEHKAIINEVGGIYHIIGEDKANQVGEDMLKYFDSYMVLPSYKGEIVIDDEHNYQMIYSEIF